MNKYVNSILKKVNLSDELEDLYYNNVITSFRYYWDNTNFNGKIIKKKVWDGMDNAKNYTRQNHLMTYSISDVYYEINEYGYRTSSESNDFFNDNLIACFGCSQTFGTGLPWKETWPHVLNNLLGDTWCVKNYGIGGASTDTISRVIYNYTINHKPKIICCFFPDIYRMDFLNSDNLSTYHPIYSGNQNKKIYNAYKIISNFECSLFNYIKNFKFIESICKKNNIILYWSTWSNDIIKLQKKQNFNFLNKINYIKIYDNLDEFNASTRARDLSHFGKDTNFQIANKFNEKIKQDIKI
jgi:hypothetical protein